MASVIIFSYHPQVKPIQINHDARPAKLAQFMDKYHFKRPYYIHEFIKSADKNSIDFALLPSIELIESSGNKRYIQGTSNPFGWCSDKCSFKNIPDAIDYISAQLGNGKYYKGKTLREKLRAYNPNPRYGVEIINLMAQVNKY